MKVTKDITAEPFIPYTIRIEEKAESRMLERILGMYLLDHHYDTETHYSPPHTEFTVADNLLRYIQNL